MILAVPFASYLLGCLCTGWFLVRLCLDKDIRTLGSGGVGARNVGRLLGTWGFAITLIGDAAKGALAVWLARHFTDDPHMEVLAGGGVIAGHIWPVQLGFRGGKGLATALGGLLVFDGLSATIYGVLTALAWLLLRNVVLSGLLAVALMPAVLWARGMDAFILVGVAVVVSLILLAHRGNIAAELGAWRGRRRHPVAVEPDGEDEL